ncbi:multidrug resistance protein [Suhomyces tanzawaensis NRRL Y-17324]|uniref:Multidrug resistance protein n=1 Tax=Suhomyces tanzawaensis NRRL Y-17324 TaxID=984487 RepID=A0A1E4SBZ0_9ASCO|nr:multidrug resistance protein [Suhomyces tanzawaensis NRRL Y-17324]ODV77050.1 multidrug resistance protein [Suhomyces tanzawaensis NRRL Y-17324]
MSLSGKESQEDQYKDVNSEANSIAEYQGFDAQAEHNIHDLARTYTRESFRDDDTNTSIGLKRYLSNMTMVPGVSPFNHEEIAEDSLNPDSDNFNSKFWVKNLRKLYESDPEYYKPSKLGIAYRNLRAYGIAADSDYQPTVTNFLFKTAVNTYRSIKKRDESHYFDILKSMDAIMRPGEVTVVLGRPGSGCSTLLKTIAAHTYGFEIGEESVISYDGLNQHEINTHHRGDVIYSAESDIHFPHLTVGDTLEFAARLRTPQNRGPNVDREAYAKHMASVYMATYGLSHTRNTNVGNDFVRGVSGGERKRVSIAEASLSGANLQCWDNATRGLDAATALEFIRALKTSSAILEATPLIAIYQCSQDAYDLFDKVVVLYEGYQIFFGKADQAKDFFVRMGWECPQRQTTADFLTSLTNPAERVPLPGYEDSVPKTAKEFEQYWKNSPEYAALTKEIDEHIALTDNGDTKQMYHDSHVARQSKNISAKSPYTVSFFMQVRYLMGRNILRVKGDPSVSISSISGQVIMALVLSSVFYNMKSVTSSFYYRGASMFFAVLYNAFASLLEIMSMFEARPIVEKHKQYALYRPSADALAGIITELPTKLCMSTAFNFIFYFMVNFRRNPGRFFFYWLMCGMCTLVMSHLFRCLGAVSTSLAGAMTPASVLLSAMIIFTGFVIPTPKMLGWSRWINYINPVGYVFEALMVNEFHDRDFECSSFVPSGPGYDDLPLENKICSVVGSVPGSPVVSGTRYIVESYKYYNSHKWRNFGIVVGFVIFFLAVYISLTEFNKGAMQKGEIALFLRSSIRKEKKKAKKSAATTQDIENGNINEKVEYKDTVEANSSSSSSTNELPASKKIFHWRDLTYQVKIKSEDRVILNHVDGWVKPGQLTALMGSSGAGKTTLLNCLSERVTTGVISDGVRMVNGHSLDSSFQRSIGYVQQQDLHLATSTVREALRFSAYLRQPETVSKKEKQDYVEYIIDLLEMKPYADALVGVAGEGLNVEQRKRLTIGVELVAKPKLLLFLDEPTSGLDSQTAWSICKLMRKLCDHGQAILCTIHQPSALLLKEFDRLLFLQKGGQTVYFGDLGENCSTLINYFEKYGAQTCPKEANPAEWMLEVVGAAPGSKARQDYHEVWKNSTEYQDVHQALDDMEVELVKLPQDESPDAHKKYAAPLWKQYLIVSQRVIVQNWRSPGYIYSKIFLAVSTSLFNGFSFFKADNSMQGLQNQMFGIFMFMIMFNTLVQQMMPYYVRQRDVYEVREAPSRTFSWFAFIAGQLTSEIPYQVAVGTLAYFCWYYPIGLYRNAEPTDAVNSRGVLMWLFVSAFFVYASTTGHLCISFIEISDNAANLAVMLFTMSMNFCGVLAGPDILPGFWIFMYRCNPMTYLIQGMLSTGLAGTEVNCSDTELLRFNPPSGQTCGTYMENFLKFAGGNLLNGNASSNCRYCPMKTTDDFLKSVNTLFSERWRNFGILICFIAANILLTIFFYWLARVPKGNREKKKAEKK